MGGTEENAKIAVLEERIANMVETHKTMRSDISIAQAEMKKDFDNRIEKLDGKFSDLTEKVEKLSDQMTAGFTEMKLVISEAKGGAKWSMKTISVIGGILAAAGSVVAFLAKHW